MLEPNQVTPRFSSKKPYKKTLKEKELQLIRLQRHLYELNIPVSIIFEG
jgi:hypothetical protein